MTPKTVLVIDDETMITSMLRLHLEMKGYRVLIAHDGEAGLHLTRKNPPDLIVLDINMPKKDGLDFYRQITSGHDLTPYPVLIMTGRGEMKEVFRGLDVAGYIEKPFEIKDFLDEVQRILEHPQRSDVFLLDLTRSEEALKIAEFLENERYRVTQVSDLTSLKEFIAVRPPGFMVMEYVHPEMAGDLFIAEVRKILSAAFPSGPRIPVIVYTYSGMDYRGKSLRAGADRYLGQPQTYWNIVEAVREFELSPGK